MKRKLTLILSFALCLCMLVGMLPFAAVADDPVAKDYDTAENGEVLYTVDFSGEDGVYDIKSSGAYDVRSAEENITITLSESNKKLTIAKKVDAADFYAGYLKAFHITGRVYTISYYIENSNPANIRVGVRSYYDGKNSIGVTTLKSGTYNQMSALQGGNVREIISANGNVVRKNDAENNNRQYFKIVLDGVHMIAKYYTLATDDTYKLFGTTYLDISSSRNFIHFGMYNWDSDSGNGVVSIGNVTIAKGDEFAITSSYTTNYDSANDGDTLLNVNFKDNTNFEWQAYRHDKTDGVDNFYEISDDGTALTFNYTVKATYQYLSAYIKNSVEMSYYGNYTYEFNLSSAKRTGVNFFGQYDTSTGAYRCVGFTYFNSGNTAQQFINTGSFKLVGDSPLQNDVTYRVEATSYRENAQNPDIKADGSPNVKVEVDTYEHTITNFFLIDGAWTKVSGIKFHGSSLIPVFYFHAWDASTNAVYKNMKIVKGLSVSGSTAKYVDFKLDGEYTSTGALKTVSAATLPTVAAKAYYTKSLVDGSGNVITDKNALSLSAGYNLVELYSKYTPEFAIQGVQSSLTPAANTTNVRLVGTISKLDYDRLGFKITAKWKDGEGVTRIGANTVDKSTTSVYTSILAGSADGCEAITAESLGSEYIVAIAINGVPTGENVQVDFTVTPYLVDNGETFEYPAQIISFVNGAYSSNATPLA